MSVFDYGNTPSYNIPSQPKSGGWGQPYPNNMPGGWYASNPAASQPVKPKLQPVYNNPMLNTAKAPNYLGDFTSNYNDLMNKLSGMAQGGQQSTNAGLGQYNIGSAGQGQYNIGNAGQGQYDIGQAGQGQYDIGRAGQGQYNVGNAGLGQYNIGQAGQGQYNVGNAGLGIFDYQNTPLANYQISGIGQNVGTGLYSSDLLNQLAGRVSSNLTNPNASLAMGLSRDQIQGQGIGARQQLTDSFAGLGGRGQGPAQAQMAQLGNALNQTQSDAYRNIAMDTEKNAIAQAQALEGMRGGFYEGQQGRQLQNAGLNQQGQIAQGDIYKNLANIGLQSFEGARSGDIANAQMGQSSFQDARNRQLQNAQLGSSNYSDAQARALQNAGMGQSSFENSMNRQLQGATLGSNNYQDAMSRQLQGAQLGSSNYSDSMNRQLQGAQLGSSNYQDAMSRQLQGAQLGANTFDSARQRELQNAQLNNTIYQGNSSNNAAIAGNMAGLLPSMANMLQNQGNMDMTVQNQNFSNQSALNDRNNQAQMQAWQNQQTYQQQLADYFKQMEQWKSSASGRQF